jgi:predicted membrane protein
MLSSIYWILAILLMIVLLTNGIYMFINNIKNERDFKRFKKRQLATLIELEKEIETRKGDK